MRIKNNAKNLKRFHIYIYIFFSKIILKTRSNFIITNFHIDCANMRAQ